MVQKQARLNVAEVHRIFDDFDGDDFLLQDNSDGGLSSSEESSLNQELYCSNAGKNSDKALWSLWQSAVTTMAVKEKAVQFKGRVMLMMRMVTQ